MFSMPGLEEATAGFPMVYERPSGGFPSRRLDIAVNCLCLRPGLSGACGRPAMDDGFENLLGELEDSNPTFTSAAAPRSDPVAAPKERDLDDILGEAEMGAYTLP